jgi:hypothetical protein
MFCLAGLGVRTLPLSSAAMARTVHCAWPSVTLVQKFVKKKKRAKYTVGT